MLDTKITGTSRLCRPTHIVPELYPLEGMVGGRILEACDRVLGDGLNASSTQDAFVCGRHATAIPSTETQETFGGNAFLCNSGVHFCLSRHGRLKEKRIFGGGGAT